MIYCIVSAIANNKTVNNKKETPCHRLVQVSLCFTSMRKRTKMMDLGAKAYVRA